MTAMVRRLTDGDIDAVVAVSLAAWAPVFASCAAEMGDDVYGRVFPDWRAAQRQAVRDACEDPANEIWIAAIADDPVGFVAVRQTREGEARAGEIYMIAVDPAHQRAGIGTLLLRHGIDELRRAGVELLVIGTGGDPGHAPARALYEDAGFAPFRQVRYFRRP
ncbi:MAG TPA: GNAT family N-acetyltransferase [Solirubrobacteraceae bacterium]|jgi:ribosomal protein S18 acetylase RimI-like enzyme|nr:GNAT family N-acetyltransferase [Solirubrobacteraceae bacterium]